MIIPILLSIIYSVYCGSIHQFDKKSIELSVNNELEISDYYFRFTFDTNLNKGFNFCDNFLIFLPKQYLNINQTVSTFRVQAWWYNSTAQLYQLYQQSIKAKYIDENKQKLFILILNDVMPANIPYQIKIPGIVNPYAGGTGFFKLQTRRNGVYDKDQNMVDLNDIFGQVGIVPAAAQLKNVKVTIQGNINNNINQVATYIIQFTTSQLIPSNGYLSLDFTNSNIIINNQTFNASTTLQMQSQKNIIYNNGLITFTNFIQDQPPATYTITLLYLINPNYTGIAGQLKLKTWMNLTNTIIEQNTSINLPFIYPGTINTPSIQYFNQLGSSDEQLFTNDNVTYTLQFQTTNPVQQGGAFKIVWGAGGLIGNCVVQDGLFDISQSVQLVSEVLGNSFLISNFSAVNGSKNIQITFTAQNSNWAGIIQENLTISSYQNYQQTQKVDYYTGPIGLKIYNVSQPTYLELKYSNPISQRASQKGSWIISFYDDLAFQQTTYIQISFPGTFTISPVNCVLKTNAGVTDDSSVQLKQKSIKLTLGTQTTSYSTTYPNTINISTVNNPHIPGIYPINITIWDNQNNFHGRILKYIEIFPNLLNGSALFQLTQDKDVQTLFIFNITAPMNIPSGYFQTNFKNPQAFIEFQFQTDQNQFLYDLGTGLKNRSNIPCYGTNAIAQQQDLYCQIQYHTAPTPTSIFVSNFPNTTTGQILSIHFPKIKNPYCQAQVTNDIQCMKAAAIQIFIIVQSARQNITMYSSLERDPSLILIPVLPQQFTQNPMNFADEGQSSNPSPIFKPNIVNTPSKLNVRFQPSLNKQLQYKSGNHLLMIFPQLPQTVPQAYILGGVQQIKCSIGIYTTQLCYSYREVGWLVILNLTQAVPIAPLLTTNFYLSGFINPYYAADPNGYLQIYTVSNKLLVEYTIYQSFGLFGSGSIGNQIITQSSLQAGDVNVNYTWTFSLNDDIPSGGMIDLQFPDNNYNLQSSFPQPLFQVIHGLTSVDEQFTQSDSKININIFTILNFQPYTAGTNISILISGVKNPPDEGQTNYFGVQSRSKELYVIDFYGTISPILIQRQRQIGLLKMNYFTMTPDNGSPGELTGNVSQKSLSNSFPAYYLISFNPTSNIPKYGKIIIVFPTSQYNYFSFLDKTLECYLSGLIQTYDQCTLQKLTTTVTIIVDREVLADENKEINIRINNIRNFSPNQTSIAVIISTQYDGTILDQQGKDDSKSKATTGGLAQYCKLKSFNFSFAPQNEGASATYEINLAPSSTFGSNNNASILIKFPEYFPLELGVNIRCQIDQLQISTFSPIICSVSQRTINITNFKKYDPNIYQKLKIKLFNVINPDQGTYDEAITISIIDQYNHVNEYCSSEGGLITTASPNILLMPSFTIDNQIIRLPSNYEFQIKPLISANFTNILITMQNGYLLSALWKTQYMINSLNSNGNQEQVYLNDNCIIYNGSYKVAQGNQSSISLLQIPNPLDVGALIGYPMIQLYNYNSQQIQLQTYNNLNQFFIQNFILNGSQILINGDIQSINIERGTYSNLITFSLKSIDPYYVQKQPLLVNPIIDSIYNNQVHISPMIIQVFSTSSKFNIGIDSSLNVPVLVISFTHNNTGFITIRPLFINVTANQDIKISIPSTIIIPAGGRSIMQNITAQNAPINPIEFQLTILNNYPQYSDVFPDQVNITNGTQNCVFWMSVGPLTTGYSGQLSVKMIGSDSIIFKLDKSIINFTITNPLINQQPQIISDQISFDETNNILTLNLSTNEAVNIYYALGPPFQINVTLNQIKMKQLPYDYFNNHFILGEQVSTNQSSLNYFINLVNFQLQPQNQYKLTIFIEDFDGNLASQNLTYFFNNTKTQSLSSELTIKSLEIKNFDETTITINGISTQYSTVHAIAIKSPHHLFINQNPPPQGCVRNNIYQNPPNQRILQTNISTEDETIMSILIPNYDQFYNCIQDEKNYLTISCNPISSVNVNDTRKDIYAEIPINNPNGYQVSQQQDSFGIKVPHYTQAQNGAVTFKNLEPNTDYYIFVAIEQNGQFQQDSSLIIGSTFDPVKIFSRKIAALFLMTVIQYLFIL